jgi:hypothetical protein
MDILSLEKGRGVKFFSADHLNLSLRPGPGTFVSCKCPLSFKKGDEEAFSLDGKVLKF